MAVLNVDSQHAKRPSGLIGRRELGVMRAMDYTTSPICKHAGKMIHKMIDININFLTSKNLLLCVCQCCVCCVCQICVCCVCELCVG